MSDTQKEGGGRGFTALFVRRPVLFGQTLDLLEIDPRILGANAVMDSVKPLARQVLCGAVRQMPAGGEGHAENRVAGLQQRQEYRLIGRRTGMRPASWYSAELRVVTARPA